MLPKLNRLPARDIKLILNHGQDKRGKFLAARILIKPGQKISRMVVVVPVKIEKRATKRNLIRRRLSEIIRTNPQLLKLSADIVILVRQEAIKSQFSELKQEINKLLGPKS